MSGGEIRAGDYVKWDSVSDNSYWEEECSKNSLSPSGSFLVLRASDPGGCLTIKGDPLPWGAECFIKCPPLDKKLEDYL